MISIIGAGRVGSAVAFLAAYSAIDDIVLVNRSKNKAIGELLDVVNSIPEKSKISIVATDEISKIKESKVIVITVSSGQIKDERTDLLPFNMPIIQEISNGLRRYADDAKIVVVTNPVDIITYQILKETEFSQWNVMGVGSSLDSSRLRYLVSRELGINQSEVEGIVMGEHGPTMVPVFSNMRVQNKSIKLNEKQKEQISFELKNYWRYLIAYKGVSVFGAAKNTFDIVEAILNDKKISISTQVYLKGQYGFDDLCMGVPTVIGKTGVSEITELNLDHLELELLAMSAAKIKNGLDKIKMKRSY